MRRDIEWKTKRVDGTFYEVRASFFGGKFKLQFREHDAVIWDYKRKPLREDLEKLSDAIQRRYQRRQASETEVQEIQRLLREFSE
jgi:hypothetical protein